MKIADRYHSRGGNTKSVAAFSTAGAMDGAKRIVSIVKEKGIKAHNETLPMKVGTRNHRRSKRKLALRQPYGYFILYSLF